MANSKIIITFLEIPSVNFTVNFSETNLNLDFIQRFRNQRLMSNQVTIPQSFDFGEPGSPAFIFNSYCALNFLNAFNLDYNTGNLFTVTAIPEIPEGTTFQNGKGQLIIEANYAGAFFVYNNDVNDVIQVEVINNEITNPIEIEILSFLQSDVSPCQNIDVSIETSVLATKIISSIPLVPPTEPSQNLLLYSNDMSNSVWEKINSTTVGNKFIPNTVNASHGIRQFFSKEALAGNYTFSFYAKAAELFIVDFFAMRSAGSGSAWSAFNLNTGEVFYAYGVGAITYISHSLTNVGDGYYRYSINLDLPADNQVIFNVSVRSATGESTYPGNNSDGVILERFQVNKLGQVPYLETTNEQREIGYSDGTVINGNTDNPFIFTAIRNQTFTITVENEDGNQASQVVTVPNLLQQDNFSINIVNSPNGATISVSNINSEGLNLQYSLDNDEFQNSNTFSGLENGDYTLYVRDQYGCSFEFEFNVNEGGLYIPHFYISKSNSIPFAQRITFGDAGNYKNDENTLSCEADVLVPYKEVVLFQTADVITTQFQTNYSNIIAKVIQEDLSEVIVDVIQKTNNIGIREKRDALKFNLGNGKTGIYFMAGNIYNFDTNATTGTYNLNGSLPEWAIIGAYINISTSWYIIENIFFDESKNADVIVINEAYNGIEALIIVGSIYNDFNFEEYEFAIDMVDYIGQRIRVKLELTDDNFAYITLLSEEIAVEVRHRDTLCIDYYNIDNNDVNYSTGIKHRLRIPFTKVEGYLDEESSTNKTDTNVILMSADLYKGKRFIFEPMTENLWEKVCYALSHKIVIIDGVQYVKNGEFETEGPLEQSNLYVLTAKMLKAGAGYSSEGSTVASGSSTPVELPTFIEGNNGFIKY